MFTIHNIQYQGQYGLEIMEDVFGLPQWASSLVEQDGDINLMKGAIESAHRVTTVSPTYAQEILDPWFSRYMDSIVDCGEEGGFGFTFQSYNADDMYAAICRALGAYANKEHWPILVQRAMETDFSWGRSANEYIRMYRNLLKG